MEKENKLISGKKEKIISWFKDPYNLVFVLAIVFIVGLRFYYFTLTKNQPIWWDESEYMSKAKAIAGLVEYQSVSIRSPLFPGLMSIFFFLGITNEVVMRFLALFLPSIIVVLLTYFLVKQMYPDKRVALISMILMGVLWEHLFYSNRFHTENIALIFEFLAILVLYQCYFKKQELYFIKAKYSLIYVLLFTVLSFLFRPGNILFAPAIILFLIIVNKDKIFNKKGLIGLIIFAFLLICSFIFTNIPQSFLNQYLHLDVPLGWNSLTVFYGFFQSVISPIPSILFYALLIGFIVILFKSSIILDKIKSIKVDSEDLEFKSNIFNLLLILTVLFIFVFIMRATIFEYRWFFPLLPAMLAFTSKGIIFFSNFIGSITKSKYFSAILVLLILFFGAYNQVVHADSIIKVKVDSYSEVRDAAIWAKQNYDKSEEILTISYPQTVYYSEMNVLSYSEIASSSDFDEFLNINKPKLLEISGFENHPSWINDWIADNEKRITPVRVYFADESQQQPLLILYEISYDS